MVLFITWDGPNQPFLKSLFLPPFRLLASRGVPFEVLQFSWGPQLGLSADDLGSIRLHRQKIPRVGFPFVYAPFIALAAYRVLRLTRSGDVLLPRSHIPLAIALAARALRPGLRLVWDTDGFMPDERVDFGGWRRSGPMYWIFRALERAGLRVADVTLTRTHAARAVLAERYGEAAAQRVSVVPNGRDPSVFKLGSTEDRAVVREELGVPPSALLLCYCGSLGPQYLPGLMMTIARALMVQFDAHWLVLTGMREEAEYLVADLGPLAMRVHIRQVGPLEVPRWLSAADVGLAFRADLPSQKGVAPLKIAEYLLCGLPVITTGRVGDLDRQLGDLDVSFTISPDGCSNLQELTQWVGSWFPSTCALARDSSHRAGLTLFSLESSLAGYQRALELALRPKQTNSAES